MIYQTIVTVPTAGVPQPLAGQRQAAVWVKIQALDNNGALGYVVGLTTAKTAGSIAGGGIAIAAGGVMDLPPCSDTNFYDLAKIYVDMDSGGDGGGFRVLWAVR